VRALIFSIALMLAGCVHAPVQPRLQMPALALSPASLGARLSLAQRLTVQELPDTAAEEVPQERSLEAQLEVEPAELRLAAFAMNQRVLLLRWDGHNLDVKRHPMLPAAVDASRVLRDIQLVYWPLASVQAALPADWTVEEVGVQRLLKHDGEIEVQIAYAGAPRWRGRAELDNRLEHYRLSIDSSILGDSQP
jgi:hypothetical protein